MNDSHLNCGLAGRTAPRRSRWWTIAVSALIFVALGAGLAADGIAQESVRIIEAWNWSASERKFASESKILPRSVGILQIIGIAFGVCNSTPNAQPFVTTFDDHGRALHGWHTALLPFVEQSAIYHQIDQKKPWNHPHNKEFFCYQVREYLHPVVESTVDADGYSITTYAANIYAFGGDHPRKLPDFKNGASNVLLVGEMAGNYRAWGYPLHYRDPKLGLNRTPVGFGGPWKAGTQFLMVDGSVRSFRDDTDPEFLQLLAEPARD